MLLTRALPAAGLLTFAACLVPALSGQPAPPPAQAVTLPLTRVTLFTAGVGYFHREGTVDGPARVEVRVPEGDINDLIKTLVATDPAGPARAVTYDNKAPDDATLKAFPIDLTENPSVGRLLRQVRGERVEVTDKAGGVTAGTVVSVEIPEPKVVTPDPTPPATPGAEDMPRPAVTVKPVVVPPPADAAERVHLLTDDGVRSVPLAGVQRVKFVKPELQAEVRKALDALAARGAGKTVGVTFPGAARRAVSLGYVAEAPLWKPTYRVTLDGAGATVQGWAAVENTTDEDWRDVRLSLVSGRPTAFRMDLYDPLFVPRPLVEPELYASLRPPVYQGAVPQGVGQANFIGGFGGGGFGGQVGQQQLAQIGQQTNLGVGGGVWGVTGSGTGRGRVSYEEFLQRRSQPPADASPADALRPGGAGDDFGQSFRYDIADPVSLPRFKSALLPVVRESAGVERVSVFNPGVLDRHPMLGLRLTNKSKQFLAQGPVAVFDGGTYAGDARLPDVQPGESRLLGYAIDLDVTVEFDGEKAVTTPAGLAIESTAVADGKAARRVAVAVEKTTVRATTTYRLRNRSGTPRTVLVTKPALPERKLVSPDKPTDRTAELYRFAVPVGANGSAALDVTEEWTQVLKVPVGELPADLLDRYLARPATPAAVTAALARVKADRAKLAETEKALAEEDAALRAIADDQARMRSNIERVPKESQAFQRYLKKFDDQETEIERRQARAKELRADVGQQKQATDAYLRGLSAE
jgi:hypothetical protein